MRDGHREPLGDVTVGSDDRAPLARLEALDRERAVLGGLQLVLLPCRARGEWSRWTIGRPRTVSRTTPANPSSLGRRSVETMPGRAATSPPTTGARASSSSALLRPVSSACAGARHGRVRARKNAAPASAVATTAATVYETGTGCGAAIADLDRRTIGSAGRTTCRGRPGPGRRHRACRSAPPRRGTDSCRTRPWWPARAGDRPT